MSTSMQHTFKQFNVSLKQHIPTHPLSSLPVLVSLVVDHASDQLLLVLVVGVGAVHSRPGLESRECLRKHIPEEHHPELDAAEKGVGCKER